MEGVSGISQPADQAPPASSGMAITQRVKLDNNTVAWMKQYLSTASDVHFIHASDIKFAHDLDLASGETRPTPLREEIPLMDLYDHLLHLFPESRLVQPEYGIPLIRGIKWARLDEECFISQTISMQGTKAARTPVKRDARELLHLPQPDRTITWLKLYFTAQRWGSVGALGITNLYRHVFEPFAKQTRMLDEVELLKCITKTFPGSHGVLVSDNYCVIAGVSLKIHVRKQFNGRWLFGIRDRMLIVVVTAVSAMEGIRARSLSKVKRLQKKGLIDPPKTLFGQKLLEDPLLSPYLDEGVTEPGPFLERLRRRRNRIPTKPVEHEDEVQNDGENSSDDTLVGAEVTGGNGALIAPERQKGWQVAVDAYLESRSLPLRQSQSSSSAQSPSSGSASALASMPPPPVPQRNQRRGVTRDLKGKGKGKEKSSLEDLD